MKKLIEKFISLFLALSFAFQLAVTGYAEMQSGNALVTNTYNANSGLLTKFVDALDNSTIYAYNLNNNRITSVAYDANKNGVGDGTESIVNYAYSKGRLSTITHNGFNYGFTYDNFGNMLTTTVGGNALVTNTYGSNNGMLTKSAYGNGYNVLYTYDKFNRVIAEKQGSNALNRFYYDNNGNLATVTDGENGIEYNYEYDFIGRPVRSFATKNSADYLSSQIKYDEINRITQQKYILADGTKQNYSYNYTKDNLLGSATLPNSKYLSYTYDALNRPVLKVISGPNATACTENYSYLSTGSATTSLISKITYNNGKYLQYTYNEVNNITAVLDSNGGKRTDYSYDGLGQLIRENNPHTSKTYVYAYDKGGNITSVKTYAYTTATTLGTPTSTITYTYGDSAWKDKLTSYNGTAITYDSIGNPLSYRNGTLAWTGRQLKSHTSTSGTTTIYTYNSDGVRIGKKSVYQGNTSDTSYVVSGTQILSETKGSSTNYYIYDEKGLPIGIVYNGTTYTYRKNLQGDVIAILNSAGTEVVTYTYNAWGAVEDISGSLETTLGAKNPFRYRGYYYDTETGYYYLNSRYYDPTTGRFLNADGFVSTGQGLLGTNMYAYCGNNPVNMVDYNGDWGVTAFYLTNTAFSNFRSDFTVKYQNTFEEKMKNAAVNVIVSYISEKITNKFIDGIISVYTLVIPFIPTSAEEKHYFSTWLNKFKMNDNDHFKISLLFGSNNNQAKIEVYREVPVSVRQQIMGHTFEYTYCYYELYQTGVYEFAYNGSYEEMIAMLSPYANQRCYYKIPIGYKF